MNVFDYLFQEVRESNKVFILSSPEQSKYNYIYQNSLKLSNWLNENVGENEKILLISPNSIFFIIAYLGIMKSGNVCVPVNPSIETSNLEYILNVTKASSVFLSSKLKTEYTNRNIKIFNENDLEIIFNRESIIIENQKIDFDSERMAQILFTSGSTGHPKGVMLSHKNLMTNTDSIIKYLNLKSDDIMEVVLPFYYCYGLSLLHTHLRVGGSIVLNNTFIFLGSVLTDLEKYKCTGFAGVPSHFQILLRKSKSFKSSTFPQLKYVTQAGGKLHNVFIKEFTDSFPDKKFFVMYGQTEATARLSYLPPDLIIKKIGSIGKGIPNVNLKIVNNNLKHVKVGEIGELVAKGDNIMMGYLNDPEGNKKALRDGWLHTGDMAKMDKEGFLYLYARKKEIIKVGGKRVSPKEIEEIIVSIQKVISCKIKSIYDDILGEAIQAIIVLKDGTNEDEAKKIILKNCRDNLALYKIPSIIKFEKTIADPLKLSK